MTAPSARGETTADTQLLVSIVIPICNEEAILLDMLTQLTAHFDEILGRSAWNFILVENGSTDRTNELARKFLEDLPGSQLISMPEGKFGKSAHRALTATVAPWAHLINIEQWDMDFFRWAWQHRERYDLILGSKRADPTLNHQSRYRKFLSFGLNTLLGYFFEYTGADSHGPKLMKMASMRRACVRFSSRPGSSWDSTTPSSPCAPYARACGSPRCPRSTSSCGRPAT
jgi:glycosyltransferase involved in cell wall biosynthesis